MLIIPAIPTHAQNRLYRRIANRYEPTGTQVGTPIPGALTETEVAHKARRRSNRAVILKSRIHDILAAQELATNIKRTNEKFDTKEAKAIVSACDYSLKQYREQLSSAQVSLDRILN